MRTSVRVFYPVVVVLAVLSSMAAGGPPETPPVEQPPKKVDLFEAGKDGYATYRIPGIVVTRRGVVLAYCSARQSGIGDWDHIDIALRRSLDGGQSWQPSKILVDVGKTTADNPTAIADRQTGAVHFLYQINYARCYYLRSDDDGQTFTAPVDITTVFEQFRKDYDWNVIAPGPGHGIQLDNGRLLVPVWLSTGGHRHRPSCVATIYSDDQGRTWHRGEIVVRHSSLTPDPGEGVAVQLTDGRVMLNIRNESRRFRRLVAFSKDGATNWTEPAFDESLFDPACFASIVRADRPGAKVAPILFANPDSRSKPAWADWCQPRETLTIKVSEDDGRTWPVSRVLEPGISGYSDLAVAADGSVLCLYERGGVGGNMFHSQYLTLARFPLDWVYRNPQEQLAKIVHVGDIDVATAAPPPGLVVRRGLGILTVPAVDGQVVHRARGGGVWSNGAIKTPKGDYLLLFPDGGFYGWSNKKKVNDMLAYRSSDKGKTWSGPTVTFKIDYSQHGFSPLVPRGSKRIYAFGTQPIPGKRQGPELAAIGYRFSDDDGRTWSDVRLIEPVNDPGFLGISLMRMCETDRGTWLLGSHTDNQPEKGLCTRQYVLRSEDQGKTWTLLPGKRPAGWSEPRFHRLEEGRVIDLPGGRALMLARTMTGRLWELRSQDDGRTWSAPQPTTLVHPDTPAMLFRLADGKTLLVLHHNVPCHGAFNGQDRATIWASLSSDEGRTWSEPRFVFANALEPGKDAFMGYHCSYVDMFADGEDLHLFVPHRWQRVLHLHLKQRDLAHLPTKADLSGPK